MLSFTNSIEYTSSILRGKSTLEEIRLMPTFLTRKRKMPFEKMLKYILSMYKTSTQAALNHFFEKEDITMSQQALSKARSKIKHTPFLKIYNAIRDAFYAEEHIGGLGKCNDKFIIAIDGSETPLPNLPKLREKFGGTGAKASSPTARMSIAYDVMNDIIIDAAFSPLTVSERDHAIKHVENVGMAAIAKHEADAKIKSGVQKKTISMSIRQMSIL